MHFSRHRLRSVVASVLYGPPRFRRKLLLYLYGVENQDIADIPAVTCNEHHGTVQQHSSTVSFCQLVSAFQDVGNGPVFLAHPVGQR